MADDGEFSPLAVLGVGYMGGSLALAARAAGLAQVVRGFDPDAAGARVALERGIVDEVAPDPVSAVAGARLVVLAGPVGALVPLGAAIARAVAPDALVIDIGSVKAPVIAGLEATALVDRFVGCHPLAGTEASGAASADPALYRDKPCFICPGPRTAAASRARAERFWLGIGARVLTLDAAAHDAFMAAASHLPHVGAFALAASLEPQASMLEARIPPSYPPTSLRDSTRVAASNPPVWRDILLANSGALLPLVDQLLAELASLRAAIGSGDGAALQALLERGQSVRRRVVK